LPLQHLSPRERRAFRCLAHLPFHKLCARVRSSADLSVFTRREAHVLRFLR